MKSTKPTTAITARATIVVDENQSSSLPLSSISCIEPTHNTSSPRPTASTGTLRVGDSRLA